VIENNILIDTCKEMVFRSSGTGSVVRYTMRRFFDSYNPYWVEVGLNASHMAVLTTCCFRRQLLAELRSDFTHANAIYLIGLP